MVKRERILNSMLPPKDLSIGTDRIKPEPIADLETGMPIDEHDLDGALVRQPDFFYRVAKQLALLISQRDGAKQTVTEEEARCDAQFRADAVKQNEKTTETEIKNMVRLDRDVRAANERLHELNRKVGQMGALKEAFQQRSFALKHLVDLYIANYYTSNADGGSSSRALKDHVADRAKRGMSEARRRRDDDD